YRAADLVSGTGRQPLGSHTELEQAPIAGTKSNERRRQSAGRRAADLHAGGHILAAGRDRANERASSRSRDGETVATQLAAYGVLFRDQLVDYYSHIRFQQSALWADPHRCC